MNFVAAEGYKQQVTVGLSDVTYTEPLAVHS